MTQPYGQDPVPGSEQPQYGQQQPYGQPQYAQAGQQYGQPYNRNAAMANAFGDPISSGAKFGVVGATFAGVGAILVIIAFTAVDWFSSSWFNGPSHFSDIHDGLSAHSSTSPGLASAYFSWLGWMLLVVGVLLAIAATLPSPASGPLRAFGAVIAAGAVAFTFFAIQLADGTPYSEFIKHASVGFYLALGGFVLIGIGALAGPSNRN